MSRPFSYNDENFTVIGNILFVHIYIGGKSYGIGDKVVAIPQGIFNRMFSYTNVATISNNLTNGGGGLIGITCSKEGNLIIMENIGSDDVYPLRYMYAYYVLKDI